MARNGAGKVFFPANPDLADILGDTDFDFENFYYFFDFVGPWKQWPGMAPNGAGKVFFRLIQTLPTFWATWIWILIVSISGQFVCAWVEQMQKICICVAIFLGGPMGPIHPVWALAAIHLWWANRCTCIWIF